VPDLDRQSLGLGQRPALIVVDVIRGFTDPECPLGSQADAVVESIRQLADEFRVAVLPIFFTTVIYHDENQARVFRERLPALNVLQPDSPWVEIDPRLGRRPDEQVIEKQWASAFFATPLNELLIQQSVDSLVVCGLTTSGCVRATAVDGLQNDFRVVIPREATGDRNQQAHESNLFDLNAKYADVVALEDVLAHIRKLADSNEIQRKAGC
jgi:nicotinamidase-related amidase